MLDEYLQCNSNIRRTILIPTHSYTSKKVVKLHTDCFISIMIILYFKTVLNSPNRLCKRKEKISLLSNNLNFSDKPLSVFSKYIEVLRTKKNNWSLMEKLDFPKRNIKREN